MLTEKICKYLSLERELKTLRELMKYHEDREETILDRMDKLWYEMSDLEHVSLNQRKHKETESAE